MFANSSNLVITGGTFVTHQNFHTHHHIQTTEGLSLLQKHIAPGALHNSDERYDPPKCHPRTRQAVLKKIMEWVKDPRKLNLFLWLYGPAGSGKSAIAQTISEMCHEAGLLAATFFFSRTTTGRNEKTHLIITLLYQMIMVIPEIRDQVIKSLEHNPHLLSLSLSAQTQALVLQPIKDAIFRAVNPEDREALQSRPRFIIVDGLDECNSQESQIYILEILSTIAKRVSLPLFFLIASRPEQQIRDAFNEDSINSITSTLVLDDTYAPDEDIRVLLESRFDEIKRKHPSRTRFPALWPVEQDVRSLVRKASGQFIYAATVIKYVESRRHLPPDRLQIILGLSEPGSDTPFAELDALYQHILSSVYDVEKTIRFFTVFLLARSVEKTPRQIESFLFLKPGEIDIVLSDLHSLLVVPPPEDTQTHLRISHASLGDFLLDRSRSGSFFIDFGTGHTMILRMIIKHMMQDKDNEKQYRTWTSLFEEHYSNSISTDELVEDLGKMDWTYHLNKITSDGSPSPSATRPATNFWSKAGVDERWPNIARLLCWLHKHRHSDPRNGFQEQYRNSFDSWIYTTINTYYPHELGTEHLLTALSLPLDISEFSTQGIYDIVDEQTPWKDIDTLKWKDPLHLYDTYYGSKYRAYYYGAIAEYLSDASRSKEYFVDGTKYARFSKVLLDYISKRDRGVVYRTYTVDPLYLLSLAVPRSSKLPELVGYLCNTPLRTLDSEDLRISKKHLNEVADVVNSYLEVQL